MQEKILIFKKDVYIPIKVVYLNIKNNDINIKLLYGVFKF